MAYRTIYKSFLWLGRLYYIFEYNIFEYIFEFNINGSPQPLDKKLYIFLCIKTVVVNLIFLLVVFYIKLFLHRLKIKRDFFKFFQKNFILNQKLACKVNLKEAFQ